MEIVDVVNENNQVLYQMSKHETHEKGLLHRCILGLVIDSQKKWILVKQASDRQDAGQYVMPVGGHIIAGESEIDALKREALEELGLKNFTYEYIGKGIYNREVLGRRENHYFIHYEIRTDEEPKLNHESVEYRRFSLIELKTLFTEKPQFFGDAFHFEARTFYKKLFL